MIWNDVYSREDMPTINQVGAYIGTSEWTALYQELVDKMGAKPKLEHSRCSIPGWNVKFKKNGKSLCTVYPKKDLFQILIIANQPYQKEIEAVVATSVNQIQEAYQKTEYMRGGKWLIFDIDSQKSWQDALKLIQFRLL